MSNIIICKTNETNIGTNINNSQIKIQKQNKITNYKKSTDDKKTILYTKSGDGGNTQATLQQKALKCDTNVELTGLLDELQSRLGWEYSKYVQKDEMVAVAIAIDKQTIMNIFVNYMINLLVIFQFINFIKKGLLNIIMKFLDMIYEKLFDIFGNPIFRKNISDKSESDKTDLNYKQYIEMENNMNILPVINVLIYQYQSIMAGAKISTNDEYLKIMDEVIKEKLSTDNTQDSQHNCQHKSLQKTENLQICCQISDDILDCINILLETEKINTLIATELKLFINNVKKIIT